MVVMVMKLARANLTRNELGPLTHWPSGLSWWPVVRESGTEEKEMAIDKELVKFQDLNCRGLIYGTYCFYADPDKVGTGQPCCTKLTLPEVINGICQERKTEWKPVKREPVQPGEVPFAEFPGRET
jgi:hypothetical protein